MVRKIINTLNANPTKWSNTLKQFADILNVHELFKCFFVGLAVKGSRKEQPNIQRKPCFKRGHIYPHTATCPAEKWMLLACL